MTKSEYKEARSRMRLPNLWKAHTSPLRLAMEVLALSWHLVDDEDKIKIDEALAVMDKMKKDLCLK